MTDSFKRPTVSAASLECICATAMWANTAVSTSLGTLPQGASPFQDALLIASCMYSSVERGYKVTRPPNTAETHCAHCSLFRVTVGLCK